MSESVQLACEPEVMTVAVANILPLRKASRQPLSTNASRRQSRNSALSSRSLSTLSPTAPAYSYFSTDIFATWP
jgi:hypothetical protein